MRKPHNVEYFYKGAVTRAHDWPMVLATLAFHGGLFVGAVWLFFR